MHTSIVSISIHRLIVSAMTIALVTGSSSRGIGRGIVKALALSPGYQVIIHGLEEKRALDAVAEELNETLGFEGERRIFAVAGDIRDDTACERIVREIQEEFGSLDVLVNNAGCQFVSPIHTCPTSEYDRIVDTILKSTWLMTKYGTLQDVRVSCCAFLSLT